MVLGASKANATYRAGNGIFWFRAILRAEVEVKIALGHKHRERTFRSVKIYSKPTTFSSCTYKYVYTHSRTHIHPYVTRSLIRQVAEKLFDVLRHFRELQLDDKKKIATVGSEKNRDT